MAERVSRVLRMFSATFPSEIQELAGDFLDSKYRSISVGFAEKTSKGFKKVKRNV